MSTLIGMQESAIPELERALDRIENSSDYEYSYGAKWFLIAYASIKQQSGFDRLNRFLHSERVGTRGLVYETEQAIAIALNLRSYVSSRRALGRRFDCIPDPLRTFLDDWLLSWEHGDAERFTRALQQPTRNQTVLDKENWRARLAEAQADSRVVAVGYRIDAAARSPIEPGELAATMRMYDSTGNPCGSFVLSLGSDSSQAGFQIVSWDSTKALATLVGCTTRRTSLRFGKAAPQ